MALALGEGAEAIAPLGRAVIGGLAAATAATLLVLPSVYSLVMRSTVVVSVSLDPDDPESLPTLLSDLERCRLEVVRAARRARMYQPEQVSASAQRYTGLYRPIAEPADHEDVTPA